MLILAQFPIAPLALIGTVSSERGTVVMVAPIDT
jgi:hypothetical protein